MSKHTPGPWWINSDSKTPDLILASGEDQNPVVATICRDEVEEEEAQANAYLIASAPELLEALQTEHNANIRAGHHQTTCETCLLIAKAEGK